MFLYLPQFLIIASLLHIASSTVFYVIPESDDHYTTNNSTYTLTHYLDNANKYFTSHIHLHFLPGQYYLNTDLIIQHVSNLSLIGNRTNEVINSVIKCTSPASIVVVGSNNIVIANIVMNRCGKFPGDSYREVNNFLTTLFVFDSKYITLTYFRVIQYYQTDNSYGLKFINVIGNVTKLLSNFLLIQYDNSTNNATHFLSISYCQFSSNPYMNNIKHALEIQHINMSYDTMVLVKDCKFVTRLAIINICIGCSGNIFITVSKCNFVYQHKEVSNYDDWQYGYDSNNDDYYHYYINELNHDREYTEKCTIFNAENKMVLNYYKNCMHKHHQKPNQLQFVHCSFKNTYSLLQTLNFYMYTNMHDREVGEALIISIVGSTFHNNRSASIIWACQYNSKVKTHLESLLIKNTTLQYIFKIPKEQESTTFTVAVKGMKIYLEDVVISNTPAAISLSSNVIIDAVNSYLTFSKYIEISNNTAYCAVQATKIHLAENTILNLTNNTFLTTFNNSYHKKNEIEDCFIQYTSTRGNLDEDFQHEQGLNYSILFSKNKVYANITNINLKHCTWDTDSAFLISSPLKVNQKFIHYDNFTFEQNTGKRHICLCNTTYNCQQEKMGPFYPGQFVQFSFVLNKISKGSVIAKRTESSDFACKSESHNADTFVSDMNSNSFQLNKNECKNVSHIISHKNGKWCELCYIVDPLYHDSTPWVEMYTILLQPCPKGFSLHPQGYCKCDPNLSSHIPSLTTCDIDHQTILRPANTWISAHTINNLHSYHVSLHCPFDYCLPHSSQLNLSMPDSQCQFNRSGVLCGQCKHGLSTVFGSSQCKHCSNIYMLIIIPLGIAGIMLVLLLFAVNLTVTDGMINSFLLYMNIVSINTSALFLTDRSVPYTFVALANLDLGIETCFCNGMDDYAKMWLQLVFPIYLIFIATLLIITSRYSTTIQRLTARRALPVLATLFLLSYTKVLLTVSNVLFSYTSITHLPSNHTTLVWSVDANVPLFGVKFAILFIACLILFLILVPFNVILLFTRPLSYFKVVTYFKPLLDAYQGPYKIRFYYWTGLQLVMRAVFFGVSALDRDINLMISSILIGIAVWLHGKVSPFNDTMKNAIESSFLLNLLVVFIVSLYTPLITVVNILVSIATVQLVCISLYNICCLFWNIFLHKKTRVNFIQKAAQRLANFWQKDVKNAEQVELVNAVPDVTFNYKEFQEPLLAVDK
ncbi:uncharacterized protein [Dysidea avara]|uniref:uncharacterized protein isoform X1 n=1 Tax=Dysidea avara TaxID=196820 RepID=UPI00331EC148